MLRLLILAVLVLSFSLTCTLQAPPTIEAELSKYGVLVTPLGLQAALKDDRPEVRGLAASKLAAMKDRASVDLIMEALEEEKDAHVRFNMAAAQRSLRK